MKKHYLAYSVITLALFSLAYLVELNQRFFNAKEVDSKIVQEINKNFLDFGFDYKIKLMVYDDLVIHQKHAVYDYDRVYLPKSKLDQMSSQEIARIVLDIGPCQFVSSSFLKPGTREAQNVQLAMNTLIKERKVLNKEEIKETWNKGLVEIKTYSKTMSISKPFPVDKANNNVFYYFDPKMMELNIKNNLSDVMSESFSDKVLIKFPNKKCPSEIL